MKYKANLVFISFIYSFWLPSLLMAQNQDYYFSYQIDSILKADASGFKFQTASWNYSFIGNYSKALEVKDQQFPEAKGSKPSKEQTTIFQNYKAVNAKEAILKEAQKTRIVIINESHHIGLHRVFTSNLLKDLHKLGYTFIGMEALAYNDSLLNKRAYPNLNTGFYTKEPCFGNLIRKAINTGYNVFPYEKKYEDSTQKQLDREYAQAINIKKLMDQNPNSKFIIYCGYDHAVEDTLKNFMGLPMAGQLKNLTGINPFTIDQTNLTEYYVVGNSYRKLIQEENDAVFIDSTFKYFNHASKPKAIDCNLFHPNTKLMMGRPSWLLISETKFMSLQKKIDLSFPYLIKVYLDTDDLNEAVPIDIIEVKSKEDDMASLLFKNKKHVIVAVNSTGIKQIIKIK